jgi:hypothetical protein
MKQTTLCEPCDLIEHATTHMNLDEDKACDMVDCIRPEFEVKTLDFTPENVLARMKDAKGDALYQGALELLMDFMNFHDLSEFTLTQ